MSKTARELFEDIGVVFKKISGTAMSIGVVEFTPDLCKKLLKKVNPNSQRIHGTAQQMKKMKEKMEQRWIWENADPITFSTDDRNVNGQLRMKTSVEWGINFKGFVFLDSPATMDGRDEGKRRALPDQLHEEICNYLNESARSSKMTKMSGPVERLVSNTISHIFNWKVGSKISKTCHPESDVSRLFLKLYPHTLEICCNISERGKSLFWTTPAHLAFVATVGFMADHEKAMKFIDNIIDEGVGLVEGDPHRDYVLEMKRKILDKKRSQSELKYLTKIGSLVKCWNTVVSGVPQKAAILVPAV